MKHNAFKATVECTTAQKPEDLRTEIYYQACLMAHRLLEDKKLDGCNVSKADMILEIDFHG